MRTTTRAAATALLTGAMLAATVTTAAPVSADQAAGHPGQRDRHPGVQAVLDQGVTTGGLPGVVAEVRDGRHRWFGEAGVADITTGRPRQEQDRFRIGSTTKTFVSTVVLQLAAEGRLSLDDSVEHWLPGVLDAPGYQPDRITVRQLLNHTSGVPNFAMDDEIGKEFWHEPFLQHRFDDFTPERLVGIARAHQPDFAPGAGWTYSDTNYVLAGMIVERASGSLLAQQIRQRITTPLGLTSTYEPASDDVTIHGPHGREYSHLGYTDPNTPDYDVTELSPSWGWASGDMISTTRDLNTFFAALLGGRLLPPAQQQEMFTMVQTPADKWIKDTAYGLGVSSVNLPCTTVWGMGGAINGSWTYTYGSRDGRHLLSTNVNGDWLNGGSGPIDLFTAEVKAEFCPGS